MLPDADHHDAAPVGISPEPDDETAAAIIAVVMARRGAAPVAVPPAVSAWTRAGRREAMRGLQRDPSQGPARRTHEKGASR